MVARTPLPEKATPGAAGQPAPRMEDMRQELWSATESEDGADGSSWAQGGSAKPPHEHDGTSDAGLPRDVPDSLRPGHASKYSSSSFDRDEEKAWGSPEPPPPVTPAAKQPMNELSTVPEALRPGGGGVLRPETNPFKRKTTTSTGSQEAVNVPPVPLLALLPGR